MLPPLPEAQDEGVEAVAEAALHGAPEGSGEEAFEVQRCSVVEASSKIAAAMAARAAGVEVEAARKRPAAAPEAEAVRKRPAAAVASVCKRPSAKQDDKRVAFFDNERSRSQILCRGPEGSFAIKYKNALEEKQAIEKAKLWVKKVIRLAADS